MTLVDFYNKQQNSSSPITIICLDFVMDKHCVYFEIGSEFLYDIYVNLRLKTCSATATEGNLQFLSAEARVRYQAIACKICSEKSGTCMGVSPRNSFCCLSVAFYQCSMPIFFIIIL
jgi:hypothetical protein